MLQQRLGFRVSLRGGGNHDVHTPNLVDFVEVDFGENDVLFDAQSIVATPIKRFTRNAAEVADPGHRYGDQTIEEFIHAVTAQGNLGTHRHAFAHPETSNRVAGKGCQRFLASDGGQVFLSGFGFLAVTNSFGAAANVQNDFVQTRDLVYVLVLELFF